MTPRRVLAIRPDASLVSALASVLDRGPQELECCGGNVDALQRLRGRSIDVVITDPSTTVEEDLALASELKAVCPAIRTIVLAPHATHGAVVDAIRAHVFACFTPPFDYSEIADMTVGALRVDGWHDGIHVVSGAPHWLTLKVASHLLTADRVVRFMTELQSSARNTERDLLIAAFREMLLNAMEHGAGFDREKIVEVTAARTARAIVYHFKDPGAGFERTGLDHATASPSPEDVISTALHRAETGLRPGGFGMLIARQVADEIAYNEPGNEVLLIKHIA